jgi:hypothetical protein
MTRILFLNTNVGGAKSRDGLENWLNRGSFDILFLFEASNTADPNGAFFIQLGQFYHRNKYEVRIGEMVDLKHRTLFLSRIKGDVEFHEYGREVLFRSESLGFSLAGIHPYSEDDGEPCVRSSQLNAIRDFANNQDVLFIGGDFNQQNTMGDVHSILTPKFQAVSPYETTYSNQGDRCIDWVYRRKEDRRGAVRIDHSIRPGFSDHSAVILTI